MPLFQTSVLKKYLHGLDQMIVNKAWDRFTDHFHSPVIQENIRNSREEQYQEGFFRDLFVEVFGYILNPTADFNLTTELKNIKDAKKTDGAILKDGEVTAVIELKGTDTTDLGKVEVQAFGYKNNHPNCKYVITSNFEKLRFYIDNAVEHVEFNLFTLTRAEFDLLWLCISSRSVLNDLPGKIKEESLFREETITRELYKDYAQFRNTIFENIQLNNSEYDKLTLFQKTQKLLDRFLFVFFAEDRLLLPPNSIRDIARQWTTLKDLDAYVPLYSRYKKYFGYLNTGHKGKQSEVFAYNGGLFAPDKVLDNLKIDDDVLLVHTKILSTYDFESEVSVNILGHIFEHSLNDIEEIQSEIEGRDEPETQVSRRKKDGVFYTPKYITKYIVDHTLGVLCTDKKNELDFQESEFESERKGRHKETLQSLMEKLETYREWLLDLKICDPACGSGAFLNQALEFLIAEHGYLDELQNKLLGNHIPFSNIENSILEHNLYGVDINEESVEIAKLSLWLRTAEKGRKLTSLNDNIKCGNSLIDNPLVAGDKAFNWHESFPRVFQPIEKLGYHIVLTTHNSRTSSRMVKYRVKKGDPIELNLYEEIALTKIIRDIIIENGYNCLAYNICKDHVHLILVCESGALHGIVQKIKSISSKEFHRLDLSSRSHDPLDHGNHLWSQKFFHADLQEWEEASMSHRPGYTYDDDYLGNAIAYIQSNRKKHGLPDSPELRSIIKSFTKDLDEAFEMEYKGGFDVVIGNPPYVRHELFGDIKPYLQSNFEVFEGTSDLFAYFYEKSFTILSSRGAFGFISNTFDKTKAAFKLREYLSQKTEFTNYIDFTEVQIFQGVTTYPIILTARKSYNPQNQFVYYKITSQNQGNVIDVNKEQSVLVSQKSLDSKSWSFNSIEK